MKNIADNLHMERGTPRITKKLWKSTVFILLADVFSFSLMATGLCAGDKDDLMAQQAKAHEIAQAARSLGLSEDDPIIVRAQEIWWDLQEQIEAIKEPALRSIGTYKITGYDPYCSHCCGKSNGITASGTQAAAGRTVAMSGMPFGTKIYIEGLGYYVVEDRGVKAGIIDVACSGHLACYAITGSYHVYIVES